MLNTRFKGLKTQQTTFKRGRLPLRGATENSFWSPQGGYNKKYKRIRETRNILGFECFSYSIYKGKHEEDECNFSEFIAIFAVFSLIVI